MGVLGCDRDGMGWDGIGRWWRVWAGGEGEGRG